MEYITDGHHYHYSYKELREQYQEMIDMKDEDFLKNLPKALHLACFICFIKEIDNEWVVGDRGIVHELVHILVSENDYFQEQPLREIRESFKTILELA